MEHLKRYADKKKLEGDTSLNWDKVGVGEPMDSKKKKSKEDLSDLSEAEMNKMKVKSKPTGGY